MRTQNNDRSSGFFPVLHLFLCSIIIERKQFENGNHLKEEMKLKLDFKVGSGKLSDYYSLQEKASRFADGAVSL